MLPMYEWNRVLFRIQMVDILVEFYVLLTGLELLHLIVHPILLLESTLYNDNITVMKMHHVTRVNTAAYHEAYMILDPRCHTCTVSTGNN